MVYLEASIDTYKEICNLISELHDVSTFFVTPIGDIIFECTDNRILNPLYQNDKENLFTLLNFEPELQYRIPIVRKTYFLRTTF